MKRTIFYFLVLLFAVWLGALMYHNPGYVLIAYHNLSIETSLWFAVIILGLLFLALYILLRFGSGVRALASYIKQWISNRRQRRAHKQTVLGLYDFIEGNWLGAEKKLLRAAKHSDMALINYLVAALMATRQNVAKRRDNYLRLAHQAAKDRPLAAGLIQAHLQIFHKEWDEARTTLKNLQQLQPKNSLVLQLLRDTYLEQKDWRELEKLVPLLRKYHVINLEELNKLEQQVYCELLLLGAKNRVIASVWRDLPNYLQKNPALVAIYAEHLLTNNQPDDAEAILKIALHKTLDQRLLELYAMLVSNNPLKQLVRAEKWLQNNPENVDLLLCLGRICKNQKLWGKARSYLEKSLRHQPTPIAYAELAQLMASQDNLRGAIEYYVKGISVSLKKT